MMLRQLLKLLLLLVVFVINLPSCWSLCDISAERLRCHAHIDACHCQQLDPSNELAKDLANRAADQAGVLNPTVIEAYLV